MTALSPEVITEQLFPNLEASLESTSTSDGSKGGISTAKTVERKFPKASIARNVISDSIDTQQKRILAEYSFGESGAIAIGRYIDGISGDLRITPDGIVARNKNGVNTITIDGSTGDITIKGTLAAGSLIASNRIYLTDAGIFINDDVNDVIFMGIEEVA